MGDEPKPLVSFLVRKNNPQAAGAAPVQPTAQAADASAPATDTQPPAPAPNIPPPSSPPVGGMLSGKFKAPGKKSIFGVNNQRMSAIQGSIGAMQAPMPNVSQALGPISRSRTGVHPKSPNVSQASHGFRAQAAASAVPDAAKSAAAETPRALAEQLLQKGLDHFDRGEFEPALSSYNEAIATDPTFAMPYNNMGMVLIDLERYEEALKTLFGSIGRDANYAEAYNNLGFVLRRLGHDTQAAAAYKRFLTLEPDVEESAKINAWIEGILSEHNLTEPPALEVPGQEHGGVDTPIISEEPEKPVAPPKIKKMAAWEAAAGDQNTAAPINALGEFAPEPQHDGPAIAAPAPVQPLAPPPPPAPAVRETTDEQNNRQIALIEKSLDEFEAGNIDDARTHAEQALAINASNSEAHTALGKILVREEKFDEGIQHLEDAIALDPLDPAPFYVLGFTLRALERNVEAAEIYEKFLQLMPDAVDGPKMRQWIMHINGIAQAEGSSDMEDDGYVDREPIESETDQLYKTALEHFKSSTADAAIEDCERILAEQPEHVRTRLLLGRAHLRRQDFDSAATAFAQALEVQPDSSEALYFMGQCEEKRGDSPRALKLYRSYIENHPHGARVPKLRAWFLSHGVSDTGKGLSQQIQCEWCLRYFDENEISLHENKATCNGCLTLMGSTPIQDSNKLEAYEPGDETERKRGGSGRVVKRLALIGGLGAVAAAVAVAALGYFTPLLDPMLQKMNLKKPAVKLASGSGINPGTGTIPSVNSSGNSTNTVPLPNQLPVSIGKVKVAPTPKLDFNFDGTKVKIVNQPERDFAVQTRWSWKPELSGVEELDEKAQGWKTEIFLKDRPVGMTTEGGTIVWNATQIKDFEALKKGVKYTVELNIRGFWSGPELVRKDLFSVKKSFTVSSQFGYELGQEVDVGLANDARNIELTALGGDYGSRTLGVLYGSQDQGGARTVSFGQDGVKRSLPLFEGARCAAACAFSLSKAGQSGVLTANWKTGEVTLYLNKGGSFEPKAATKFVPGTMALAAIELDNGRLAVAGLSSAMGILSLSTYDSEKGFSSSGSVQLTGGGGNSRLLAWKSDTKGVGFLAVMPLAEDPLRFIAFNAEKIALAEPVRSVMKDEGVITAAVALETPHGRRLALVLGGRTSHVLLLEEKSGAFSAVGNNVVLPGPGLGAVACDFNQDGCDDLFVTTRDDACFYFLGADDVLTPGPVLNNPGMLGPAALVNLRNNSRPDIAVLNENKKARLFKAIGGEPQSTSNKAALLARSERANETKDDAAHKETAADLNQK